MLRYLIYWKYPHEPDEFWSWKLDNIGHEDREFAIEEMNYHTNQGRDIKPMIARNI